MNELGQICYVSDCWAYFTTKDPKEQWGDDWNDAPYEHNAETPYAPHEGKKEDWNADGTPKWKITRVAFAGEFEQPKDGHTNSPYSVEGINAGAIAWLRTPSYTKKQDALKVGATFEEFEAFIKRNGGIVYLPNPLHNEKVESNA